MWPIRAWAGFLKSALEPRLDRSLFLVIHHRAEKADSDLMKTFGHSAITIIARLTVWRALTEAQIHSRRPEINWFQNVRVRRNEFV